VEPGKPKRQRIAADQRRAQIIEIARAAFIRDGMKARTKDIAAEAGVDSALIYHYFKSKNDLFEAAVLEPLAELVEQLRRGAEQLAGAADPTERYDVLRDRNTDMARIVEEIVPLLGLALFSDPTEGRAFYQERFAPRLGEVATATAKGMATWTRPGLDAHDVVLATFGVHLAFALHSVIGGNHDDTAPERINEYLWLGLAGTAPQPPTE
jgi:AcrR family transcriptional regulator